MPRLIMAAFLLAIGLISIAEPGRAEFRSSGNSLNSGENMISINLGKTLIVYYSFSGNTRGLAELIAQKTGGTLFEIETVEPYEATIKSDDPMAHVYEIAGLVKDAEKRGKRPELKRGVTDIEAYDLIIIGSPLWMPVPPPVLSFLAQHDLSGKKLAPFYTHRSTPGDYFNEIARAAPQAIIFPGEKFTHGELSDTNKLEKWLFDLQKHYGTN